jgi:hypothetical protein
MADQAFPRFPDIDLLTGQWTPIVALDLDMSLSTELDDVDLRFLDTYNNNIPFEFGIEPALGSFPGNLSSNSTDPCRPAAMCTEAFRNSHWRFRPSVNDHAGAEDHNLSLPSAAVDHASPESRISLHRRVTCARLSVAARDRILAMVVESCRPENLSRAIASFPSVELLETLFQFYLTSPIARADSYIHSATFDPNEKRPELLAAMAAAGAILTSDVTLTKLGYAIQECVRLAVPKHVSVSVPLGLFLRWTKIAIRDLVANGRWGTVGKRQYSRERPRIIAGVPHHSGNGYMEWTQPSSGDRRELSAAGSDNAQTRRETTALGLPEDGDLWRRVEP